MITQKCHHIQEWQESAIAPELIEHNLVSVSNGFDVLFIGDKYRINTGVLGRNILRTYSHLEDGGHYGKTYDHHTDGEMQWVQFKPDKPRKDFTGKVIKYESPKGEPTRVLMPLVPFSIWEKIAKKFGAPMPEKETNFWHWLRDNPNIPLCVTEGNKKANCLLSYGYPAIAFVGIWNGLEKINDYSKEKQLKEDLKWLLGKANRKINIIFDQDQKQKTVINVNKAIFALSSLLSKHGHKVNIVQWLPSKGKGIDDFLVQLPIEKREIHLENLVKTAPSFNFWSTKYLYKCRKPDLVVNTRYLSDSIRELPKEDIALIAPHGTGKTSLVAREVQHRSYHGKKTISLVHLESLAKANGNCLGLSYRTETSVEKDYLGFSLCVDSCRDKFNGITPEIIAGQDYCLFVDEIDQVIPHLLNSETEVSQYRCTIIDTFTELVRNAEQVIISDADLSDVTIDLIENIRGKRLYLIKNEYQYEGMTFNQVSSPLEMMAMVQESVNEGKKIFINTTSQKAKSKYGTIALESFILGINKEAKVLRIDSETTKNPEHPAYKIIDSDLNKILIDYDYVIASPCLQTGVSITLRGHFDRQFNFSSGNIVPHSFLQQMWRLRDEKVERFYSVPNSSNLNLIGNKSSSPLDILKSNNKVATATVNLLGRIDSEYAIEYESHGAWLESWAKLSARHNSSMRCYSEILAHLITSQGHNLNIITALIPDIKKLNEDVSSNREKVKTDRYSHRLKSPDITDSEATELESKEQKIGLTLDQRCTLEKHKVKKRYGNVTMDILSFDDDGLYPQLKLFYYLTIGNSYLRDNDRKTVAKMSKDNKGKILSKDLVNKTYSARVKVLEILKLTDFIDNFRDELLITPNNPTVIAFNELLLRARKDLRTFGVNIGKYPMANINAVLNLIGHKFTVMRDEQGKEKRIKIDGKSYRCYRLETLPDFAIDTLYFWLEKDSEKYNTLNRSNAYGVVNPEGANFLYINNRELHPNNSHHEGNESRYVHTLCNIKRGAEILIYGIKATVQEILEDAIKIISEGTEYLLSNSELRAMLEEV